MSETSTVAKEIERKYLLSGLPRDLKNVATEHYKVGHGWLPGEIIQERITFSSKSGKFFRVIKTGKGIERIEAQEEISVDYFAQLWPLTKKRIAKTRWLVPFTDGEHKMAWEVDDFEDRNLFIAEIEIPTADYNVVLPFWMRNYVVREVTNEPEYLNINLASNSIGTSKGSIQVGG